MRSREPIIPPRRWRRANWAPKGADLVAQRDAVNAAANRSRGLWLGYIVLLAYLFITVGAVTHRDLLMQSPVKLPVLNVDLPLVGFFAVAGVFFIVNHFYLLLNLLGLSRRIKEFNEALEAAVLPENPEKIERRRLDTFVIVQMLGGTAEERSGKTGFFLRIIALITLVIAPVFFLLFIQLKFLPYQNELITWQHRIILLVDLWLLWIFWPAIRKGDWDQTERPLSARVVVLFLILFSFFLATFPGEYADGGLSAREWKTHRDSELWWAKGRIFGTIALTRQEVLFYETYEKPFRGLLFFARALDLSDEQTLIDAETLDKIRQRFKREGEGLNFREERQKPWQSQRTRSFRNRNLRGVVFDRSDLRNVDFSGANLQGASLDRVKLQGASLESAKLQGASLNSASLQGALLDNAHFQRALLHYADLQDASLEEARLQGASLDGANLQGASLARAILRGASLTYANLEGASLHHADLLGASLKMASLKGASLDNATLQRARLTGARLQGASLEGANLQGAWLDSAELQGASLEEARLQGASLDGANLQGASLARAILRGAFLDNARLQGALLSYSKLEGASLNRASLQGSSLLGASLRGASMTAAFFWRSRGYPKEVAASEVNVYRPMLGALSSKEIDSLEKLALDGVDHEVVRARIKDRLAPLTTYETHLEDAISDTFWTDLNLRKDTLVYERTLTEILRSIACDIEKSEDAPYSARGLIRFDRLRAVGPLHLRDLHRYLLDAAEGRRDDCPGVKDLDEGSIDRLR